MHHIRLGKILLLAGLVMLLTVPASASFTDTEGHWAEESINKWSQEYGIINGYDDGTSRPDNSMTRGAFAGILDRFLQFQAVSSSDTFSDIEGNYWEEAILKLHASGVYLGNNGKALAGDTITRQQAVTMIARAFRIEPETTNPPFADANLIAAYAEPYVAEMQANGYLRDCTDGYFRPTDPITRAELVSILGRMIQVLVQEPVTYAKDVKGTLMINSPQGATLECMKITGDLIIGPNVEGEVVLCEMEVGHRIRNFSGVEPTVIPFKQPQKPERPKGEAIDPLEMDEPGKTTGNYLTYSGKQIPIYEDRDAIQLSAGDFVWDEDRLVYVGDRFRTRFGIDVSAYQNRASKNQTIDWEAVAADGVDFAMIRIGLRGTSTGAIHADSFYEENIRGAMAAGIETGVYFFAQAITVEEAIEEAEFVLDLLEDLDINGPVAYDWEMHDSTYRVYGTPPEMATACAVAFCERVEAAGYDAMVYAGQYVSYIKYDQGALAPYLYWYPEYKSDKSEKLYPTFYYQMNYWQFSSSCAIDGIGGRVDANIQFIPRK